MPSSQNKYLQETHAFAVSPGSLVLRTYPDDAGAALATSAPTLRGYAARNPGVRWRLWGHLKMRGFISLLALSAAIGLALGTSFSWLAILVSSVALAGLSAAVLRIAGF